MPVEAVDGCKTTKEIIKQGSGDSVVSKGNTVTVGRHLQCCSVILHYANPAQVHATGIVQQTGKKARNKNSIPAPPVPAAHHLTRGLQFWSTKDAGQQAFTYQVLSRTACGTYVAASFTLTLLNCLTVVYRLV